MRILIGADTYAPDVNGASYFAQRLATGLAGRGHEVHVACPSRRLSAYGGLPGRALPVNASGPSASTGSPPSPSPTPRISGSAVRWDWSSGHAGCWCGCGPTSSTCRATSSSGAP